MPFTKLKLTTFGTTLETKWKQGKGVHFTRIAMGDGLIGSGSMINRTALVHERHSLRIDGVVATDDAAQAAVIATLDNKDLTEGFLYRELALMAQDPDTGQEGAYLYDNAGQECEFLDTQNSGVVIYERMKLLIRTEQTDSITFDASGNPLNITWAELEGLLAKKAALGDDGKVPAAQLPAMDFDPAGSAAAVQTALSGHTGDNVRHLTAAERTAWNAKAAGDHTHTAAQVGAVPTTRKVNGKALSADITLTAGDVGAAAASHSHGAGDIVSGTLDAGRIPGLAASKITSGTLSVARGGTGQSTLTESVVTKAVRQIYAGTSDMTAGTTALTTGIIYLVYE